MSFARDKASQKHFEALRRRRGPASGPVSSPTLPTPAPSPSQTCGGSLRAEAKPATKRKYTGWDIPPPTQTQRPKKPKHDSASATSRPLAPASRNSARSNGAATLDKHVVRGPQVLQAAVERAKTQASPNPIIDLTLSDDERESTPAAKPDAVQETLKTLAPVLESAYSNDTARSAAVKRYIQRTFAPQNAIPGVDCIAMQETLEVMIKETSETGMMDVVDWDTYELPQQLIREEWGWTAKKDAQKAATQLPPPPKSSQMPATEPSHPQFTAFPPQSGSLAISVDPPMPSGRSHAAHTPTSRSGYSAVLPSSSQTQQSGPSPASSTGQVYAVRVGWFPGIYANKAEANWQTKKYPLREQGSFNTRDDAEKWLVEPSARAAKDAETRPKDFGHLSRAQFMRFVDRAWSKSNQLRGVETKEMMEKLRLLFKQACENVNNDVDWNLQPLPQVLLSREKENAKNTAVKWKSLGVWSGALSPRKPMANTFAGKVDNAMARSQASIPVAPPPTAPPPRTVDLSRQNSAHAREVANPPTAGVQALRPLGRRAGRCFCKKEVAPGDAFVVCANAECPIGIFHKPCAGFKTMPVTSGWRCFQCRPKPPPGTLPPSSSQVPPSSQPAPSPKLRSSPPLMDVIPQSAPLPVARSEPEPPLHPEQARIVECILTGANVFYTGSAGTGKSTVLKSFVGNLKRQGKHVDIIAPSGIAALNVGGMTIYAYAGWHPDSFKEGLHDFIKKSWSKKVRRRLCTTDVLVIDEISMVERDVLVRLDMMMREVRSGWKPEKGEKRKSSHGHSFPFGGAQIVVTGDFCQLPPVKPFKFCMWCGRDELPGHSMQDGRPLSCKRCQKVFKDEEKWAFQSEAWRACKFSYFELQHIHRQSDKRFIDILQKCRYGQPLSPEDKRVLQTPKPDPVGAVKLLPLRNEVNNENLRNFNALQSTARKYDCQDVFMWRNKDEPDLRYKSDPKYPNLPEGPLKALDGHRFEEQVRLKEGMLVILLVNLDFDTGLVNGSQGRIIGFERHSEAKVFPPKMPPNSPSRGRSSEAAAKSAREAIIDDQVRDFISSNGVTQWPVVEFHNGHVQPIYAHCQLSELGSEKPYSLLGRTQIPLLAAWAITVHKSQGMTLSRVIVDLHNSFEREMVYVALSRARSLEGLKVVRLARSLEKGGVNEQVQQFLRQHGIGGCR